MSEKVNYEQENLSKKFNDRMNVNQELVSIYINGIQVRTDYIVRKSQGEFFQALFAEGSELRKETRVTIRIRQADMTKEIEISGIIRLVQIGEFK